MKSDASTTDVDTGPSIMEKAPKISGKRAFAIMTKRGAKTDKMVPRNGTTLIMFSMKVNSSAKASTEESDAMKVIGIVHRRHSVTVATKLNSIPT